MAYYKVCPRCGANLDPGEACECKEEAAPDVGSIGDGKAEQIDTAVSIFTIAESEGDRKRWV